MLALEDGRRRSYDVFSDRYLRDYFTLPQVKTQLVRVGLMTKDGRILSDDEYKRATIRRQQRWAARQQLAHKMALDARDSHLGKILELQRQLQAVSRVVMYRKLKGESSRHDLMSITPLEVERTMSRSQSAPSYRASLMNQLGQSLSVPPLTLSPEHHISSSGYHSDDERPRSEVPDHDEIAKERRAQRKRYLRELDRYQFLHKLDNDSLERYDAYLRLQLSRLEQARFRPFTYSYADDDEITNLLTSVEPEAGLPEIPDRSIDSSYDYKGRGLVTSRPKWRHLQLRRSRENASAEGSMQRSRSESPNKNWQNKSMLSRLYVTSAGAPGRRRRQPQVSCECYVQYIGGNTKNDPATANAVHTISITQQHCGGNAINVFNGELMPKAKFQFTSYRQKGYPFSLTFTEDNTTVSRISTCCESRYAVGTRLGAKKGVFRWFGVQNAVPCYKCQMYRGLEAPYTNYTTKPIKRKKPSGAAILLTQRTQSKSPSPNRKIQKQSQQQKPKMIRKSKIAAAKAGVAATTTGAAVAGATVALDAIATSEHVTQDTTKDTRHLIHEDEERSANESDARSSLKSHVKSGSESQSEDDHEKPNASGSKRSSVSSKDHADRQSGAVTISRRDSSDDEHGEKSETKPTEHSTSPIRASESDESSDSGSSEESENEEHSVNEHDHDHESSNEEANDSSRSAHKEISAIVASENADTPEHGTENENEHNEIESKSQSQVHEKQELENESSHQIQKDAENTIGSTSNVQNGAQASTSTSTGSENEESESGSDSESESESDSEESGSDKSSSSGSEDESKSQSTVKDAGKSVNDENGHIENENKLATNAVDEKIDNQLHTDENVAETSTSAAPIQRETVAQINEVSQAIGPSESEESTDDSSTSSDSDSSDSSGSSSESDQEDNSIPNGQAIQEIAVRQSEEEVDLTEKLKSASSALLAAENTILEIENHHLENIDQNGKIDNQQTEQIDNHEDKPIDNQIQQIDNQLAPIPEATLEMAAVSKNGEIWYCAICNFDNEPTANRCRICGVSRTTNINNAESTIPVPESTILIQDNHYGPWACRVCNFDNNADLSRCRICGVPKSTSEPPTEEQLQKLQPDPNMVVDDAKIVDDVGHEQKPSRVIEVDEDTLADAESIRNEFSERLEIGKDLEDAGKLKPSISIEPPSPSVMSSDAEHELNKNEDLIPKIHDHARVTTSDEDDQSKVTDEDSTLQNTKMISEHMESTNVIKNEMESDGEKREAISAKLKEAFHSDDVAINNVDLDETALQVIGNQLKENQNIRSLTIRNCHLTDDALAHIDSTMLGLENLQIKTLNLNMNYLTSASVPRLIDMVRRDNVESILIRGNRIDDNGMATFLEGIKAETSMKRLDIGENGLGHLSAKALSDLLAYTETLQAVSLGGNSNFDAEDWDLIGKGLAVNTSLETINLDYCNLGDQAIEFICEGLKNNHNLRSIDLDGNNLTDKGATFVLELIDSIPNLSNITWVSGNNVSVDIIQTLRHKLASRS